MVVILLSSVYVLTQPSALLLGQGVLAVILIPIESGSLQEFYIIESMTAEAMGRRVLHERRREDNDKDYTAKRKSISSICPTKANLTAGR